MAENEIKRIDIKIEGLVEDQGSVRFSVFREKIDQLNRILSDSERQAAHIGQAKSYLKITDLKQSSAYLAAEPFEKDGYTGTIDGIELLEKVLTGIESGVDSLGKINSSLIRKIQDICAGDGEKFKAQTFTIADQEFALNASFSAKAQKYLDQKYTSLGEIKGVLGRVNVHDRTDFYIYPEFGEGSIVCHFDAETLMDEVRSALGKIVIASGEMEYIGFDAQPSTAFVTELDISPDNYEIPSVESFSGKAPNLTGDKDTFEFIRDLRDEWERH